jgi:hypothetical protein
MAAVCANAAGGDIVSHGVVDDSNNDVIAVIITAIPMERGIIVENE